MSILNRLGLVSTQLRGDLGKMLQFLERCAAGIKNFEIGERLRVSFFGANVPTLKKTSLFPGSGLS